MVNYLTKYQRLESLIELVYQGLSIVERRTKCRKEEEEVPRNECRKEEGLDLCLEDIFVKGLGLGIDQ